MHGFGHPTEATLFPQSIGMGATWDTELARAGRRRHPDQLCLIGDGLGLRPVQDLARDNRWGRFYETWAEEPLLAGAIGAANITGMQGARVDSAQVAATVKHFAGYRSRSTATTGSQERASDPLPAGLFLPSYAAAINAGADTVTVNPVDQRRPRDRIALPATTELRHRSASRASLITDYDDVTSLSPTYHTRPTSSGAVAETINAGVDMAMMPLRYAGWNDGVLAAVHDGLVSEARIDQSVHRSS